MKRCPRCGITKGLDLFYRSSSSKDGAGSYCKECSGEYNAARHQADPSRDSRRRYGSGMSREQQDALLKKQGGLCAICRRPPGKRRLAFDHNHATGGFRGFPCIPCNLGLGSFQDNIPRMQAAIVYLNASSWFERLEPILARRPKPRVVKPRIESSEHGESGTKLYWKWAAMKARCNNLNDPAWPTVGARGITYDPAWETYEPFRDWARANGCSDELQLGRWDSDGNYTPENCRWFTKEEAKRHHGRARMITIWGETKSMIEWSEDSRCVVNYNVLNSRITLGWDPERALTTPVGAHKLELEAFGETKPSLKAWSKDPRCVVSYALLNKRFSRGGWDLERAMTTPVRAKLSAA